MQRLSGKNFDVYLGDMLVHVESASLDIEDSSEVAKTNGIPNGWTDGEVGASGEIEVDAANLKLVTEAARNAGSFRGLPEFDILFYGSTGDGEESKIEAFGCKLKVSKLADLDPKGGEKVSGNKAGAEAVGKEIARLAKEKSIEKVVFDRNGYLYHGKIKAVADGAREGGLEF